MKKSALYRGAAWVSDALMDHVSYAIERLEADTDKTENESGELACYKAVAEYLENMDFLKAVKL